MPTAVAVASAVADLCGHDGMPATRKSSAAVAADDDAGTPSPVAMKGKKPAWVEPNYLLHGNGCDGRLVEAPLCGGDK